MHFWRAILHIHLNVIEAEMLLIFLRRPGRIICKLILISSKVGFSPPCLLFEMKVWRVFLNVFYKNPPQGSTMAGTKKAAFNLRRFLFFYALFIKLV